MADSPQTQYWILVSSLDNWHITAERDFTVQGIKSRHRKKAEQMKPGDKFVYYCTGVKAFAGITTVKSEYYEDHTPIWESENNRARTNSARTASRSRRILGRRREG